MRVCRLFAWFIQIVENYVENVDSPPADEL